MFERLCLTALTHDVRVGILHAETIHGVCLFGVYRVKIMSVVLVVSFPILVAGVLMSVCLVKPLVKDHE